MAARTKLDRVVFLAFSLLSGCAAAGPGLGAPPAPSTGYGAYLIGQFAQDTNDLDTAAANLLLALRVDPANPTLLNQAFLSCALAGRPEAASLARRLPDNPVAQLLLGDEAARHGDWAVAQSHFAALKTPGLADYLAPLLIAWTLQGRADPDAALATLRPKLQGQPLAGVYALHSALIADLANRYPQAQALYAVATGSGGGVNLRLARILANWELRQGRPDDAAETLDTLGRQAPGLAIVVSGLKAELRNRPIRSATDGLAEVYLSFAAELQQQNGSDTALALLRLALTLRPDLTAARLLMAETLAGTKHADAALAVLAAVPDQDPLGPLVRIRRAGLQAARGDLTTAEAGLRRLAQDLPDRPEPLAALADLQRTQQHLPAAIASYDQAIGRATPPASWPLFFARAVAKQQDGRWPEAEADLREALSLSPDQPEVLNFLGYAWADRGEHLPQARTMLDRAAQLRPNDGAIVDSLGWVQLRQGDVADAIRSLEKAVQIMPEDPEVNGHLGDAYWAAGRKLQARYQWDLALNLKPDPAAVPKLQAKLADAKRATGER